MKPYPFRPVVVRTNDYYLDEQFLAGDDVRIQETLRERQVSDD